MDAAGEAEREAVNRWIVTSGAFDGVIDFAGAVAPPRAPDDLGPRYDSGDHIHLDAAGYRAMADAVDLDAMPWIRANQIRPARHSRPAT
jgi:lysophospholipase L1-like esterase